MPIKGSGFASGGLVSNQQAIPDEAGCVFGNVGILHFHKLMLERSFLLLLGLSFLLPESMILLSLPLEHPHPPQLLIYC